MANGAFPALVVHSYLTKGQVTLGICARMLLVTMALTAVAKVSCEGDSIKHWFPRKRGSAIMGEVQPCPLAISYPGRKGSVIGLNAQHSDKLDSRPQLQE